MKTASYFKTFLASSVGFLPFLAQDGRAQAEADSPSTQVSREQLAAMTAKYVVQSRKNPIGYKLGNSDEILNYVHTNPNGLDVCLEKDSEVDLIALAQQAKQRRKKYVLLQTEDKPEIRYAVPLRNIKNLKKKYNKITRQLKAPETGLFVSSHVHKNVRASYSYIRSDQGHRPLYTVFDLDMLPVPRKAAGFIFRHEITHFNQKFSFSDSPEKKAKDESDADEEGFRNASKKSVFLGLAAALCLPETLHLSSQRQLQYIIEDRFVEEALTAGRTHRPIEERLRRALDYKKMHKKHWHSPR